MNDLAERSVFREERTRSTRNLSIGITPAGDFRFIGQDLGDEVEDLLGAREYEFWFIVDADWKDRLLLALVEAQFGSRSSGLDEMRKWLDARSIAYKFETHRGE